MPSMPVKDGNGSIVRTRTASGDGTSGDPYVPSPAVTVADGSDVALGAKTDTAATDSTSSWSAVSLLKGLWAKLPTLVGGRTPVDPSGVTSPGSVADGADVTQGAKADTAATGDTGTWSVVALIKRGLERWTTYLTAFGTTADTGSGTGGEGTLHAKARNISSNLGSVKTAIELIVQDYATSVLQTTGNAMLTSINDKLPVTVSGGLPVNVVAGSSAGQQYTEGDTDASISGTATMWEDTGNTLRAVSAANPFPVNVVTGSTAGTQYTEGATSGAITGTALMWEDTSDTLRAVSAAKPLPVNVISGSTAGTQYTEGDVDATITGTALMLEGAGNALVAAPGTAADGLLVNLGANNDVTATQSGTWNIGTVTTLTGITNAVSVNPITGQTGVAAGAGAVGATVQRATLASDDPAVVALQVIDDWDESDRAKVNLIVGQAGVTAGAGAVAANTPRFTLASDDPAVAYLGTINGAVTNIYAEQATASNQATANASLAIIDDWDESDRAKVNLIVGQAGVAGGSGVVGATTVRVTLATDVALPTGTNSVGQVTANAGTNLNTSALALESGGNLAGAATSLAVVDDWDESDRAKVNLIVGQAGIAAGAGTVGATTPRFTLASDDAVMAAINTLITATNTKLDTTNSTLTSPPPASEVHLGEVGGNGGTANATYTRPADTNAYAANDAVSNSTSSPAVLTFADCGRVAVGTGYVTKARLLTSQTACTARFRLHLYKTTPTAINDNAGCTAPLYADDAKYVGFIDFDAAQTGGGSTTAAFAVNADVRLAYKCDTADDNLYGLLQTLDAFTPASAQTFTITLDLDRN